MNNIEAAITNVNNVIEKLESHWLKPRSESEQEILRYLQATALQLNEVQEEVLRITNNVRRVE